MSIAGAEAPPPTIATQPSSLRERRLAFATVAFLAIASVLATPFHLSAYIAVPAFIPAFAGTTGLADLLTAILLIGLYRIEGTPAALAVATAYLLDALLTIPYGVTFPGVIQGAGFVGNEQSAAWLWLFWHLAFPIVIASGSRGLAARMRRAAGEAHAARASRAANAARAIVGVGATATLATYVVIGLDAWLPILVSRGHFSPLFTVLAALVTLANVVVAAVLVSRERPLSTMRLWVVVALLVSAIDVSLNAISPQRYGLAWFVGKADTFVTATVVLVSLLAAWSGMYARMSALTHRLMRTIEERRSLEGLLDRERAISTMLQEASLTRTLPATATVAFDAAYHPGVDEATIGGDWYDALELADGRIAISVGDVMGSGIRAAVTMTKLRQAMQGAAMIDPRPTTMLDVADRTLQLHDPAGFATAVAMIYDPSARTVVFASAGHLPPLVREPDGRVRELACFGAMLGIGADAARDVATVAIEPGSMLVIYTDGIVEIDRDLLDGLRRLTAVLAEKSALDAGHPAQSIVERVLAGRAATDDIAVLTMHVRLRSPTAVGAEARDGAVS